MTATAKSFSIQLSFEGQNVRNWRVSAEGSKPVTVRESALAPRVYLCLTCVETKCDHASAVREFDA